MVSYVQVTSAEGDEIIEIPVEEDKTVLLTTVAAQFPMTCGLKFKTSQGRTRGIRLANGRLHPPNVDGWGDTTYYCVFGNVSDAASKFTFKSETSMSSIGTLSSQSILERYRMKSEQNESTSSQLLLSRLKIKREPSSSVTSDLFSSLKKLEATKNSASSESDYDTKVKKISATIQELKKYYKEKLIYNIIIKSFKDLVFERPTVLPAHIIQFCETNYLKGSVGYFTYPNEMCNRDIFSVLFGYPIESQTEPLNIRDSKILQKKLFERVSQKCQEAIDSIQEVNELGFASFLKKGLVKPGSIFTDEQLYIISQSRKIKSAHDKCKAVACQIIEILLHLSHYRKTVLPNLNKEIVDSLKLQAEVVEKETRCFLFEVETKIKEGDENVMEAATQLQNHLQEAVDKKEYKLSKLKAKREEYGKVEGAKFSEMVQEYKRLTQAYNQKMELLKLYKDNPSNLSLSYIESDDSFT